MYCQSKEVLRAIARKLRQRANRLDAIAYEMEREEIRSSRSLIDPLLLPEGRGGTRTTSADKAYLIAMDKLRQAGLA
jgi:hypothetical protein